MGRGKLERWGPNHTAEPIVSRWSRDSDGNQIFIDSKPVLEFVAVFLRDSKKWSIPGGPIKPGEALIHALKREFGEDALGAMDANDVVKDRIKEMMQEHLALGIAVSITRHLALYIAVSITWHLALGSHKYYNESSSMHSHMY